MTLRRRLELAALLLSSFAWQCGGEAPKPNTADEAARMTPASGTLAEGERSPGQYDALIAGVADAANTALIEQARVAWGRARDEELRNFAQQQVQRHNEAVLQQSRVESELHLVPLASDRSDELAVSGQRDVARLLAVDHDDFDDLYLHTQLRWHNEVERLFDRELLPKAEDPALSRSLRAQQELWATQRKQLSQLYDMLGPPPFGPNSLPLP